MNEQKAHLIVRPYYQTIFECADESIYNYSLSPEALSQRPTTAANILNDAIWTALVNRMDNLKPIFDAKKNLRFLKLEGRPSVHFWLKKTDLEHHSSNYPTTHSDEFLESGGQVELFPNAVTLMVGYVVADDRAHAERVSISPPCGRRAKPAWWIDIRKPLTVGAPRPVGSNSVQVIVTRSSQQRELGA